MNAIVNPIHFKPTWFFIRMPDEADEIQAAFGEHCLALSDAEMICVRVLISASVAYLEGAEDARSQKMRQAAIAISDKLSRMLDAEFSEREQE